MSTQNFTGVRIKMKDYQRLPDEWRQVTDQVPKVKTVIDGREIFVPAIFV